MFDGCMAACLSSGLTLITDISGYFLYPRIRCEVDVKNMLSMSSNRTKQTRLKKNAV